MKSVVRKLIRITARFMFLTFAAASGTLLIASIILVGKLAVKPLDLEFLKPQLTSTLSSFAKGSNVQIKHTQMIWDNQDHHIVLQAVGVTFSQGTNKFSVPEINVSFKLSPLLHGNFVPTVINLHRPNFTIPAAESGDSQSMLPLFAGHNLRNLKQIKITDGSFTLEKFYETSPLIFTDVNLEAGFQDQILVINGSMHNKFANFVLKGQGQFDDNGNLTVNTHAEMLGLKWENLPTLWPASLAHTPRTWVLGNLSKAYVPKASINIGLVVQGMNFQNVKLAKLDGEIDFSDMSVHYMDGLPDVHKVDGKAIYDMSNFKIIAKRGELHEVKDIKGELLISGMDQEDQNMKVDLTMNGPLKSALQVLDAPAFKFASRYNIDKNKTSADMALSLKLEFPIATTLAPEQVKYTAKADLKKFNINDIFNGISLQNGQFDLDLNNERMIVKGKSIMDGSQFNVAWTEHFKSNNVKSQYNIKGIFSESNIQALGFEKYVAGPANAKLVYTVNKNGQSKLDAKVDLKDADVHLPKFGVISEKDKACNLSCNLIFSDHKLIGVEKVKVEGDDIDISLDAKFNPKLEKVTSLKSTSFKIGDNDLHVTAHLNKDGRYEIDLHASTLDLKDALSDKGSDKSSTIEVPYLLKVSINDLSFGKDRHIYNVKGNLSNSDSKWRNGYLQGRLLSKNKEGVFNLNISTKGDTRSLIVNSNNGGAFLKALGVTDGVRNGALTLHATQKLDEPWIGNVHMEEFNLEGASAMMTLLSMTSPMGVFDIVAGKPVSFNTAKLEFSSHKDGRIQLHKCLATGQSLGLTMAGTVDRANDQIKIYGHVMPMDFFNSLIRKIPLLGEIAGGEHGGMFGVHYTMTGVSESPKINVNPLSALTPGFLRNMFDEG